MTFFDIKRKLYSSISYSLTTEYESCGKRELESKTYSALSTEDYKETKTIYNVMAFG